MIKRHNADKRGVALISVLALVVLCTIVMIMVFLRAKGMLQLSSAYSAAMSASDLANVAVQRTISEFQTEISTAQGQGIDLVLPPRITAIVPAPASPATAGYPLVSMTTSNQTLFSQGMSQAGFGTPPFTNTASTVSTQSTSVNDFTFTPTRWNTPLLMNSSATFTGFTVPDWVYLTSQGPQAAPTNTANVVGRYAVMVYDTSGLLDANVAGVAANDSDLQYKGTTAFAALGSFFSGNGNGGNFANFLNWRSSSNSTGTALTTSYYGTSGPSATPFSGTPGKMEMVSQPLTTGQNYFFSRQDMIAAMNAGTAGLSANLMPQLRTFSSVANAISAEQLYSNGALIKLTDPTLLANQLLNFTVYAVGTTVGATRSYTIAKGQPIFQYRFPLSRLRWLADRQANGTPNQAAAILQHFGLTWDGTNHRFTYTAPDGNGTTAIQTLAQIAAYDNANPQSAREPDFFEMLKAAINPSSLGQTGGTTMRVDYAGHANDVMAAEQNKDAQILQIGANIIDQACPSSIPMVIYAPKIIVPINNAKAEVAGVEDVPYVNDVLTSVYAPNASIINGYLQFELWNPDQDASSSFTGQKPAAFYDYSGNALTNFQITTTGGPIMLVPFVYVQDTAYKPWPNPEILSQAHFTSASFTPAAMNGAALSCNFTTASFSEPLLVSSGAGDSSNQSQTLGLLTCYLGALPISGTNALLACTFTVPSVPLTPSGYAYTGYSFNAAEGASQIPDWTSGNKAFNAAQFYSDGSLIDGRSTAPVNVELDVQANGNWIPLQFLNGLELGKYSPNNRLTCILSDDANTLNSGQNAWQSASTTSGSGNTSACFHNWTEYRIRKSFPTADPRTSRFALSSTIESAPGMNSALSSQSWNQNFQQWNQVNGIIGQIGTDAPTSSASPDTALPMAGWGLSSAGVNNVSVLPQLSQNITGAGLTYYQDADGTVRPADGGALPAAENPVLPVTASNFIQGRPAFLHRPFRNVGELGYVFRDEPWKTLDLFNQKSGDEKLLDVFSIEDGETTLGKINPNTATEAVWTSLLEGAALEPHNSATATLNNGAADAVAKQLVAQINPAAPVKSLADLAAALANTNLGNPATGTYQDKIRGETYVRAMSSMLDTRDWTLMVDVVAQSGIIPKTGAAALTNFVVTGQKRYFAYLTIDRITGALVSFKWTRCTNERFHLITHRCAEILERRPGHRLPAQPGLRIDNVQPRQSDGGTGIRPSSRPIQFHNAAPRRHRLPDESPGHHDRGRRPGVARRGQELAGRGHRSRAGGASLRCDDGPGHLHVPERKGGRLLFRRRLVPLRRSPPGTQHPPGGRYLSRLSYVCLSGIDLGHARSPSAPASEAGRPHPTGGALHHA